MGILLPLAACLGAASDGGGACSGASTDIKRIKVLPDTLEIGAGENFQLATQSFNACGFQVTGADLAWSSSNDLVASVSATGRVTGRAGGKVHIDATLVAGPAKPREAGGGVYGSASVTVLGSPVPNPTVNFTVVVLPEDPVVAVGEHLQMTAMAVDARGARIPDVNFVWTSTRPDIAAINTNTGEVSAAIEGVTQINAHVVGAATNPIGSTDLVVLAVNGGPMPPPNISVSPSGAVFAVGETRDIHATVTDSLTGAVIVTPITWTATPGGVISMTSLSVDGDVQRMLGEAAGSTMVAARATVGGVTVESASVSVHVLAAPQGVSTDWTRVQNLPYPGGIYGHDMSVVGDFLFETGGVTGNPDSGGFREDVGRARMQADGNLERVDGSAGWDKAPPPPDPDPAVNVLAPCDQDPHCMQITREATGTIPQRVVRYQVARHAQVSTGTNIYVVGGIDAQVDLGIDPSDPGAVGPQLTRYSDRVLNGVVAPDGGVTWYEDDRLPPLTLPGSITDIAGRTAAAVVHYRNWLYVLGGWNWVDDGVQYVGRNRDEILRATIEPGTGDLGNWTLVGRMPEPLNKHAAAVAGDWLIVTGGSTGADESSPEIITDASYIARLDPDTGEIVGGVWRETERLPRRLEYHRMLALEDDLRVVVVGGDTPSLRAASADAYVSEVDPSTGLLKPWVFLPELPISQGLTSLAAAVTGTVNGAPAFRVYIAGGGVPIGGDVTDLARHNEVYFIDLLGP